MHALPQIPINKTARQWIDFCLDFRTETGFIAVYEEKLRNMGGEKKHMGTAYEATEILFEQLFNQRKYKNREGFHAAKSRHYTKGK